MGPPRSARARDHLGSLGVRGDFGGVFQACRGQKDVAKVPGLVVANRQAALSLGPVVLVDVSDETFQDPCPLRRAAQCHRHPYDVLPLILVGVVQ
jgi:hypothetical protein